MYYHELEKSAVLQQNKELRGQKRILEDNVVNEVTKELKLKENCNKPLPDQKSPVGMTRKKFPKWTRKIKEGSSFIVQGFGRSTSSIKRSGGRDSLFGGAAILNFGYTEQE